MMGYFRAPRLHGRKQAAGRERELYGGESLSATLLDADELAAVPKGYFAVYVGAEARRFVVPTSYLCQPAFRDLMERAAEEFGFAQARGIRIPCREEDFEATVAALEAAAASRRWRPGRTGTAMVKAMSL
ncbi:auxin-induced protein 15A-like [Phragmites australis]|uniref:auxin-induced protein 15A-like n=1 Tax=Phragmites australis TaxID=29695 RepID=UPI002D775CD9|nr:auxin-induced protein 15A-like [Phragmites australis]